MPAHTEQQFSPYTPQQLFDLVADIEKYPEFLPWCRAARIISRSVIPAQAGILSEDSHLRGNDKDGYSNKPDLVLIDGGAGQLGIATQVFEELGINDIIYVGIAKGEDRNAGREHFFIRGREAFQLPENDAVLHYLQRLRDEAHRFAIGAHRNKRSKSMQVSELDLIAGIGASRKKALLYHFGSARAVAAASIEEIGRVTGISKEKAKIIYQYFHGNVDF